MRSEEEIRKELNRLIEEWNACSECSFLEFDPALKSQIEKLEWVLGDNDEK